MKYSIKKALSAILISILFAFSFVLPAGAYTTNASVSDLPYRYEALQELEIDKAQDESVIVNTRVGILTAVNRALNGAAVSFEAEAIGDILTADKGHKWVNVLGSDGSMIGVYMSNEDAQKIDTLGSYQQNGSTLYIEGIYSIVCSDHQGELDIHASLVKVEKQGSAIDHAVSSKHIIISLILIVLACLFVTTFFKLRKVRARRKRLEELWQ